MKRLVAFLLATTAALSAAAQTIGNSPALPVPVLSTDKIFIFRGSAPVYSASIGNLQAVFAGAPGGATNTIQYNNVGSFGGLALVGNAVVVTNSGGAPSLSQTLPAAVQGNITALGTIAAGVWNGSVIPGLYGGTGVANSGKTLTLGASFTLNGGGTLSVASGKTGTFSNTLTLAGNDGSSLNVGAGGTLAAIAISGSASDLSGIVAGANGGTGVANTGKTLTIGSGNLTTSGGAATLAFGAGGRTYTYPNASVTLLSTGGATLQGAPSDGTGTGGTASFTQVGFGSTCAITPAYSSRIYVNFSGSYTNSTSGDGGLAQISYGTGTAPTNGAAATGSAVGAAPIVTAVPANNAFVPFSVAAVVTGLTPGTAYWLDLQFKAITAGIFNIHSAACQAFEM